MKDGTIVFFSTKLTLRSAFTNPSDWLLSGIIQLFIPGKDEHVGIVSRGKIYEALIKEGVVELKVNQRLSNLPLNVRITYYEPKNSRMTKSMSLAQNKDLKGQVGYGYSEKQAAYSAVDTTHLISRIFKPRCEEKRRKKTFCSKLVFIAYQKLGIFPKEIAPETVNPGELIKLIEQSSFFKERKTLER